MTPKPEKPMPNHYSRNKLIDTACELLDRATLRLAEVNENVNEATSDNGIIGSLLGIDEVMVTLRAIEGCVTAHNITRLD